MCVDLSSAKSSAAYRRLELSICVLMGVYKQASPICTNFFFHSETRAQESRVAVFLFLLRSVCHDTTQLQGQVQ